MARGKPKILLIEGKRADSPLFGEGLAKKGYFVETTPNGSSALASMVVEPPNLVIVNAASMRTTGARICQSIRKQINGTPVVLIVDSAPQSLEKVGADVVLILPFTLQKLLNRIRPLLPSDQKDILHVGIFQLDNELRLVKCDNRQIVLTPRLASLLKVLMEHPGEVVEREDLFKQVWDTAYTEDMRTLDVHISWLRQAVEETPRQPRYIKTVRGIGYRLDV